MKDQTSELKKMESDLRALKSRMDLMEGRTGNPDFRGRKLLNARFDALNVDIPGREEIRCGVRYNNVGGYWEQSPDGLNWEKIVNLDEIDRLTSQVGAGSTLVLTDDSVDQILTGNLGDLYLRQVGGDYYFQVGVGVKANVHGNFLLEPSLADVTLTRSLGVVYQNTNSTMLDVRVSVRLS
jgi:hypothetical protein